ncbi:f-box domain-containing protein [Nephila pilipes]|uniref:F-box domain-containing protein n=1 Tax=Nephila pilipes TaxID=299642 RepID=A0A8X6TUK0_NEPPI|nr:f-box domain-containing protein [Nephila pilipes]
MLHSTSNPEDIRWNELPFVSLVLIFKFLENTDRFHAALVCRSWLFAFECGNLWKNMSFVFRGDMFDDTRKALQFTKKHAASLESLKLTFRRTNVILLKETLNNLHYFFKYLESFSQLHSFQIKNFFHPFQVDSNTSLFVNRTFDAFKAFIKAQHCLKKISFLNIRLSESEGLEILNEIADQNEQLQTLGLTYFFEETLNLYKNPTFKTTLEKFSKLKTLFLSYQCISEDILKILYSHPTSELEYLTIICDSRENLLQRIHSNNWLLLRRKYPKLKISFHVVEIATLEKFQGILPPSTQISSFNYRCGLSLQSEENLRRHAVSIIQYLNFSFAALLNEIRLEFGFVNIPHLEPAVFDLLKNCKWLQVFTLSGVLKAGLAIKVCEIALHEGSGDFFLVH